MSQPTQVVPQPADSTQPTTTQRPAAKVGNVVLVLVLLSGILTLIPWTRTAGLAFLIVLAIPAIVVWGRARKLTDGSRGLTSTTLVLGAGAFILGSAFSASPAAPAATTATAAPTVAQAPTTTSSAPVAALPPAAVVTPAPQPVVPARPTVAAPAPRVAPAPPQPVAPQAERLGQSGGAAYYKNCDAARAAGAAPLYVGEAGYRSALDRDSDGVACE